MSIFSKFALKSLKANRTRTAVSIVGIALACALLTGIGTTVTSLQGMMLNVMMSTEGSWQAIAMGVDDESVEGAKASTKITDLTSSRELGTASLGEDDAAYLGNVGITLMSLPEALKGVLDPSGVQMALVPEMSSGRLPQATGEIALPDYLEGMTLGEGSQDAGVRSEGELAVGSTLNLDLGRFVVQAQVIETGDSAEVAWNGSEICAVQAMALLAADGADDDVENVDSQDAADAQEASDTQEATATQQTSDTQEATATQQAASSQQATVSVNVELVDVVSREFTVVGFYDYSATTSALTGQYLQAGSIGLVCAEESGPGSLCTIWANTSVSSGLDELRASFENALGISTENEVDAQEYAEGEAESRASPDTSSEIEDPSLPYVLIHENLLRYQGITGDGEIWITLWAYASILAAVVAIAGILLIYNSFSISVAERTRQFGLLASIGASRGQLSRTVFAEALLIGVIAIPAGILIGLAGTAMVLQASSGAFAVILDSTEGLGLTVSPKILLITAIGAAVMMLISAWIPAIRASKVSAVDAVRQNTVIKLSRREMRRISRSSTMPNPRKGIWGRLMGLPGFLAGRNMRRAGSRGRTVVISLAVGVVLIVITGLVSAYLNPIQSRIEAGAAGGESDILISVFEWNEDEESSNVVTGVSRAREELENLQGIEHIGSALQGQTTAFVPSSILLDSSRKIIEAEHKYNSSESDPDPISSEGDYLGNVAIFYLDETLWYELVNEMGLDTQKFCDPDNPVAIGLDRYQGVDPESLNYIDSKVFASTGTISLYAVREIEGMISLGVILSESGELVAGYSPIDSLSDDEETEIVEMSLTEVGSRMDIEIGALCDNPPSVLSAVGYYSYIPTILLPSYIAQSAGGISDDLSDLSDLSASIFATYTGLMAYSADDPAEAATEIVEILEDLDNIANYSVIDTTEDLTEAIMLFRAIQLFLLCFTVTMLVVAIANVFNTVATNILLRTREFAVLRSTGMDNRSFVRMLFCECASYAIRGLLLGLIVSALLSLIFLLAISISFEDISFRFPWASAGLAVLVVLGVLAAGVIYALLRSRALNTVEVLRNEAI